MSALEKKGKDFLNIENGTKFQKIVKTIFLALVWTCLGFYLEIYGPTQKDLKIRTHADYEEVALAVSGRSVGLFLGCLISGVLVDKLGRFCDLFIAVSLDIAAIVTVAIPWSPGVAVLWICCTVGGVVETVMNVAGQRLILNLWLEKSAAPLHVLHGGYGVGSLSVPLYSNPFLAVPMPTAATNITNGTSSNDTGAINDSDPQPVRYLKESRIEYAYAISAALVALLSVVFYFYQIKAYKASNAKRGVSDKGAIITADKKGIVNLTFDGKEDTQEVKDPTTDSTESRNNQGTTIGEMSNKTGLEQPPASTTTTKSRTWREMFNPATCSGGRLAYGIQLLVLLSFYFANANGGERIAASFVRSFSIDQLDFEGDEASFLNTSLWISHTVGRFVFFIAARWIGIRKLVLIETVGVTIISVLLSIFGVSSSTACWVLIQPLGFFIAPLWPSMIAWADHHIELTGVGMTLFLCAGGIGGLCHMRLMGYLYEHFGPRMFLYQLTGYGIIALLLTVGLTIVGAQHGSRFKWNNKREIEKSVVKGKADVTSMEKF